MHSKLVAVNSHHGEEISKCPSGYVPKRRRTAVEGETLISEIRKEQEPEGDELQDYLLQ